MKLIDISTPKFPNTFTKVDDEDFEILNQWKWSATKRKGNPTYAERNIVVDGKRKTLRMHRFITDCQPGKIIDHKDRDGLNNQKHNLRICTHSDNNKNRTSCGTSKYLGVHWHTNKRKYLTQSGEKIQIRSFWLASIRVDGKVKYLGSFAKEDDAAKAYNEAAIKHHGEFANLNIVSNES